MYNYVVMGLLWWTLDGVGNNHAWLVPPRHSLMRLFLTRLHGRLAMVQLQCTRTLVVAMFLQEYITLLVPAIFKNRPKTSAMRVDKTIEKSERRSEDDKFSFLCRLSFATLSDWHQYHNRPSCKLELQLITVPVCEYQSNMNKRYIGNSWYYRKAYRGFDSWFFQTSLPSETIQTVFQKAMWKHMWTEESLSQHSDTYTHNALKKFPVT